jgi:glycine/D-amino acid oxidase-like deaminating enzyme
MSLGSLRRVQGTVCASTVDPADQATLDPGIPTDLDRRPDVLVVGGGVMGLATAVLCRRAGIGRVLVIEAARLASAASGGAGGALAPALHQLSDPPAFVALAQASLALYRQLDQDWGRALGLEQTAGLLLLPEGPPRGFNHGRGLSCSTASGWLSWSQSWSRCRPGCWPTTRPARILCGWWRPWPAGLVRLPRAWP